MLCYSFLADQLILKKIPKIPVGNFSIRDWNYSTLKPLTFKIRNNIENVYSTNKKKIYKQMLFYDSMLIK